ncbi:hypothetical protein ACTGYU_09400, partial [Streptococcus suis]
MGVDDKLQYFFINIITCHVLRGEKLCLKVILFKKQKLTYNRFMKLTIEQTKELKTYLKDKTYSPFHRRLQ